MATGICHVFGQEAQGAGVAEVKCILTGARMSQFLEFRVLVAKFFGLFAAISSGLELGICGPLIHIGAMINYNLAKLKIFNSINKNSVLSSQSLIIGATVGLSCTFGTPITGLIASIEIVGKLWSLRTFWILFACLFISSTTIHSFYTIGILKKMIFLIIFFNIKRFSCPS